MRSDHVSRLHSFSISTFIQRTIDAPTPSIRDLNRTAAPPASPMRAWQTTPLTSENCRTVLPLVFNFSGDRRRSPASLDSRQAPCLEAAFFFFPFLRIIAFPPRPFVDRNKFLHLIRSLSLTIIVSFLNLSSYPSFAWHENLEALGRREKLKDWIGERMRSLHGDDVERKLSPKGGQFFTPF